jgi:hypothetical protein
MVEAYAKQGTSLKQVAKRAVGFVKFRIMYCHVVHECDSRQGFGLAIGFIERLNTQFIIALNCNSIADLQNLSITRASSKSFPARSVFTRRFLMTASNSGCFSAPRIERRLWTAAPFQLNCSSLKMSVLVWIETQFPTVPILFHVPPLPRERVYRAVA